MGISDGNCMKVILLAVNGNENGESCIEQAEVWTTKVAHNNLEQYFSYNFSTLVMRVLKLIFF